MFSIETFSHTDIKNRNTNIVQLFTKVFLHGNINFLIQVYKLFKTGARTRGINSGMWWEGELKSAAVNNCKCEVIISMVP